MISEAVLGSVTNTAEDENAEQEQYGLHGLLIFKGDKQCIGDAKKLNSCAYARVKFWDVVGKR